MKRVIDVFLRAVMTGFAIGIGGSVYLSCDNKYMGAFLFGTGLFVILSFGFNLFTGKVGYAVENKPSYIIDLILIWLGNLTGTAIMGGMILCTRIAPIGEKAAEICSVKFNDNLLSIFILAGFKKIENPVGKMLAVFLPVMAFILSGYEHCIANMFYFTIAKVWSANTVLYLLVMTMGNAVGGMFIPFVKKFFIQPEAQK